MRLINCLLERKLKFCFVDVDSDTSLKRSHLPTFFSQHYPHQELRLINREIKSNKLEPATNRAHRLLTFPANEHAFEPSRCPQNAVQCSIVTKSLAIYVNLWNPRVRSA